MQNCRVVQLIILQLERDKNIDLVYCHNLFKMAAAPYTHDGQVRIRNLMTSSNKVYSKELEDNTIDLVPAAGQLFTKPVHLAGEY